MSEQAIQTNASANSVAQANQIVAAGEELFSLTEAKKIVPTVNGRHPSVCTLWRWCRVGINGVRLEYLRVGRNIVTSREAVSRFFAALAAADRPLCQRLAAAITKPLRATDKQRDQSVRQAREILRQAGI